MKNYQAVLSPDTPLASMTRAKRDQAWVKICEEIERALNKPRETLPTQSQEEPNNVHGESKRHIITTIEFTLERPFAEFDEEKFKIALRLATGIDASLIRIASIRPGSTIVKIEGEQETLATIIRKIEISKQVVQQLAVETGMRKMTWEINGSRYEVTVDELTDHVAVPASKPTIAQTDPLTQSSLKQRENAGEESVSASDATNINEVVLLVHGIRDFGEWEQNVSNILEEIPGTKVPPLQYGRFDALRFWFPIWTREAPVRKLLWRIRSARDKFSTAKLSVIAHSFGTYAIGKILRENPDIRLHRLVLCGAILPSEFRWDQIQHRVATEIINDCGIRDVWPVLAQSTTFGYGPSGRFGFGTPGVRDRYHDFGHAGFFQEKFVAEFWLPWFRTGKFVKSKAPSPSGTRWHLLTIIQLKWVAILLCLICISWFGMWWFQGRIATLWTDPFSVFPTPAISLSPDALPTGTSAPIPTPTPTVQDGIRQLIRESRTGFKALRKMQYNKAMLVWDGHENYQLLEDEGKLLFAGASQASCIKQYYEGKDHSLPNEGKPIYYYRLFIWGSSEVVCSELKTKLLSILTNAKMVFDESGNVKTYVWQSPSNPTFRLECKHAPNALSDLTFEVSIQSDRSHW